MQLFVYVNLKIITFLLYIIIANTFNILGPLLVTSLRTKDFMSDETLTGSRGSTEFWFPRSHFSKEFISRGCWHHWSEWCNNADVTTNTSKKTRRVLLLISCTFDVNFSHNLKTRWEGNECENVHASYETFPLWMLETRVFVLNNVEWGWQKLWRKWFPSRSDFDLRLPRDLSITAITFLNENNARCGNR